MSVSDSLPVSPFTANGIRHDVRDIGASLIREVAHLGMGRENIVPLWFGEPDQPTPEFIRKAAIAALEAGDTFYQPNRGITTSIAMSTLLGRQIAGGGGDLIG